MADFTTVTGSRLDADSPWTEDEAQDIYYNTEHNFDHAMRCGSYAVPARLTCARGQFAFSMTSSSSTMDANSIDWTAGGQADADDADPNFSAAPRVYCTLVEDPASTTDWSTIDILFHFIEESTITTDGFTVNIRINDGGANSFQGFINWVAIGPVAGGE